MSSFLAISIYLIIKLIPYSKHNVNIKENFTTETNQETNHQETNQETTIPLFPYRNDNFMLLTTLYNAQSISNNNLRWYDNFINISDYSLIEDNKNLYFNTNNPIKLINDSIIDNAKGAELKNITLKGPIAYHFANDENNYSISEFTAIFMFKINKIQEYSVLFEMLCNTSSVDTNDEVKYIPQSVSINIYKVSNEIANIDIFFGKDKYTITNISTDLLITDNILLLSLVYNNSKITAYLENNTYSFELENAPNISLGSLPVIINKNGDLDMVLYSFAYYKKALQKVDILNFKKYINFYLTGIDIILRQKLESDEKLRKQIENQKNVLQQLEKCNGSYKSDIPKCKLHQYEVINIKLPSKK